MNAIENYKLRILEALRLAMNAPLPRYKAKRQERWKPAKEE
jgi:hypothetical protein